MPLRIIGKEVENDLINIFFYPSVFYIKVA